MKKPRKIRGENQELGYQAPFRDYAMPSIAGIFGRVAGYGLLLGVTGLYMDFLLARDGIETFPWITIAGAGIGALSGVYEGFRARRHR